MSEDGTLGLSVDGRPLADSTCRRCRVLPAPLTNGKTVMETADGQWGYVYLTVLRLCQYFGAKNAASVTSTTTGASTSRKGGPTRA
jgi:hypothetical protein